MSADFLVQFFYRSIIDSIQLMKIHEWLVLGLFAFFMHIQTNKPSGPVRVTIAPRARRTQVFGPFHPLRVCDEIKRALLIAH